MLRRFSILILVAQVVALGAMERFGDTSPAGSPKKASSGESSPSTPSKLGNFNLIARLNSLDVNFDSLVADLNNYSEAELQDLVSQKSNAGNTPLHILAIRHPNATGMFEYLASFVDTFDVPNAKGATVKQLAQQKAKDHPELLQVIAEEAVRLAAAFSDEAAPEIIPAAASSNAAPVADPAAAAAGNNAAPVADPAAAAADNNAAPVADPAAAAAGNNAAPVADPAAADNNAAAQVVDPVVAVGDNAPASQVIPAAADNNAPAHLEVDEVAAEAPRVAASEAPRAPRAPISEGTKNSEATKKEKPLSAVDDEPIKKSKFWTRGMIGLGVAGIAALIAGKVYLDYKNQPVSAA